MIDTALAYNSRQDGERASGSMDNEKVADEADRTFDGRPFHLSSTVQWPDSRVLSKPLTLR